MKKKIERAKGKLGILIAGFSTAATTFIAGVEAIKKGWAEPVGSLTQAGNIRLDKKTGSTYLRLKDYLSFANLKDIVFSGWDISADDLFVTVSKAQTLRPALPLLQQLKPQLETIIPMKAVADESALAGLDIAHIKRAENKFELAKQVIYDIENFSVANNCTRLLVICFLPPERNIEISEVHNSIEAFEEGLCNNHPAISPSMIYAYAALSLGVPFVNGSGNLTCDIPALTELSKSSNTPVSGKNFKTWETFSTATYSTYLNTGNPWGSDVTPTNKKHNEGELKEVTSGNVLQTRWLNTYQNSLDRISVSFESPVGDYTKKVADFLPDNFVSEACVILDAALFIDLAKRSGMRGIQEWLSFYFIDPQAYPGLGAEHNTFKQLINLQNALHYLKSRYLKAHLDLDYYE